MGGRARRRHRAASGEADADSERAPLDASSAAAKVRAASSTPDAPLAPLVWFKTGGAAEWLFEPADLDDLAAFLARARPGVPVMALGLGSNLIVRDGGVPGVVVRLGKPFAKVESSPTQ